MPCILGGRHLCIPGQGFNQPLLRQQRPFAVCPDEQHRSWLHTPNEEQRHARGRMDSSSSFVVTFYTVTTPRAARCRLPESSISLQKRVKEGNPCGIVPGAHEGCVRLVDRPERNSHPRTRDGGGREYPGKGCDWAEDKRLTPCPCRMMFRTRRISSQHGC